MKPPARHHLPGTTSMPVRAAGRLDELSAVVRSGRLVRVLKGEGLSRNTVEELLRPENLLALRGILTDRLSGTEEE